MVLEEMKGYDDDTQSSRNNPEILPSAQSGTTNPLGRFIFEEHRRSRRDKNKSEGWIVNELYCCSGGNVLVSVHGPVFGRWSCTLYALRICFRSGFFFFLFKWLVLPLDLKTFHISWHQAVRRNVLCWSCLCFGQTLKIPTCTILQDISCGLIVKWSSGITVTVSRGCSDKTSGTPREI